MRRYFRRSFWLRRFLKRSFWINPASLTLGTVVAVLVLYGFNVHILELIELKTYDLRFVSRGTLKPSPAVAMAVIDEKSLDAEGRWPWPRSKIATLIDVLSRDGAKVIGFDIIFSEPDENSQLGLIDRLAGQLDALAISDPRLRRFVAESRHEADNDLALVNAIKRSRAAVVLGYFFHMDQSALEYQLDQGETERRLRRIAGSKYPQARHTGQRAHEPPFIRAYAPETNLDIFSDVAAASGYFSLRSDRDGVLRWMPLAIQGGEDLFPPLGMLCAWHYLGRPPLTVEVGRYGVEGIQVGDRFVPTDEAGQLLINYLGPPKTFPYFSVTDILNGKVPKDTFKDRIVLVGATAVATYDLRNTPFNPLYPGMEVHATVIDNILTQSFMARPEWSRVFDVLAIVGMSSLTGIALTRLSPLKGMLFAAGLFALYIFLARWLFVSARVWLNLVYPLLALVTGYTALTVYYYVTERRERKKLKGTFKHYVAPLVVEEMIKDPDRLRLGGEEKVLTVLFSDLEGFTTYSERYSPNEMTEMLSEYYNRVTEQVFLHRGTLKEYVADELMAFFGAPLEQVDHAQRACSAALAMREQTIALASEWAKVGRPRLRARTGINSGPMLVGNLGSRYRFAYGVLGDQVNLGSRLEGLNKVYRTDIIIGENTARLVGAAFLLRDLDMVRVKGRAQVVRIYELLAKAGTSLVLEHEKAVSFYADGLEAYRNGMWGTALGLFTQALALWPQDGAARTMAERCQAYEKVPPPEPWDGVFDQLVK
jgi:adenylate cyclase